MSDRTIVFAGPTITAEDVRAILPDAEVLPPVAQGDVYRAARLRPRAMGIVDGVFDRVPAVWHKEILSALSDGIAVYGAASMGALRAAELDAFGMVGVGDIYAAYRDGAIEDDDEVAIAHGTAETGYRELSDAMVNIRATLAAADDAGILSGATAREIEAAAKALFYPQRTYAAARGRPPDQFEFQMLYGIRRDLQAALVAQGHRVRVYVPFGTDWFPYFMRRLGERPANVGFVLRSLVAER